jgi:hypothetical protein
MMYEIKNQTTELAEEWVKVGGWVRIDGWVRVKKLA